MKIGFVIIFTLAAFSAIGQSTASQLPPGEKEHLNSYKKEKVQPRSFDRSTWKKLADGNSFRESAARDSPPEFAPRSAPSERPMIFKILGVLAVAVSIGALIYVVVKNFSGPERPLPKNAELLDPMNVKDIDELDIDGLLAQAIAAGNFRMATRLYYLGMLRKLNAAGRIRWQKDKTNRDYLGELSEKAYYVEEMQKLTRAYEQVWYGEHRLSADGFQYLRRNFETLAQTISPA